MSHEESEFPPSTPNPLHPEMQAFAFSQVIWKKARLPSRCRYVVKKIQTSEALSGVGPGLLGLDPPHQIPHWVSFHFCSCES